MKTRKTKKNQSVFDRGGSVGDIRMSEDGHTITFPLSSEEPYRRYYWEHGELDEILSHDPKHVDLSWLKSGNAPVLDTHNRYGLGNQIGVITDAELRDGRVYVDVRLSNAEDDASTVQKIVDGIIRNVSIGYEITKFEIDEDAGTYTATRWKPQEASFVPIPADITVGVGRAMSANREIPMTDEERAALAAKQMPGAKSDDERAEEMTSVINEITELGKQHNVQDLARACIKGAMADGKLPNLALFKGVVAANLPDGTPLVNNEIGLTAKETQSFSILNLAKKMANPNYDGAGFELEASKAASEINGREDGYSIPEDLMNSWGRFTVGGRDYRATPIADINRSLRAAIGTGGNPNILTTDHLSDRFIDNLRNDSSLLSAGVTVMEGLSSDVEIPGGDQNIAALWLAAEDADAAESVPTFRKVTMAPKDVAAFTDLTRRMLQQSTIALEAYVRMQLLEAHRIAIDSAGIYGTGALGVPTGVTNTAGVGSVTFAPIGVPDRDALIDMRTLVASTNRGRGITHLGNSNMVGILQKTKVDAGSGVFLMNDNADRVVGNPFNESNQIADGDVISGVWSDMAMGTWGGLQLDRSTEAKFLSGGVRLRSIQTVDFAVLRVGSFVVGA